MVKVVFSSKLRAKEEVKKIFFFLKVQVVGCIVESTMEKEEKEIHELTN